MEGYKQNMATVPEEKRNNRGKDGVIVPVIKGDDKREEWREHWDDVTDGIVVVFWVVGMCYAFVVSLIIIVEL